MEAAAIKLITVLLSLPSFGVQANPNAPAPAEVMKYAPSNADATVFVDFRAFVENNYKALTSLPSQPAIKRDKQAARAVSEAIGQLETGRKMIQGMVGVDLARDVHWAAGWIHVPATGDPKFLLAVRGNLPAGLLQGIGSMAGAKPVKVGAGEALTPPGGGEMIGRTADGTYLVGTASWVKARLSKKWRPRKYGSELHKMLGAKPFLMVASTPSKRATKRYSREISDPDAAFVRDLLTGHRFAAASLSHNGLAWTWTSRDKRGFERARMVSRGLIQVMRAGHLATRGMVKLMLGVAHSYRNLAPEVAQILAHEKAILKVVDSLTGDGSFKVSFNASASARRVHVEAVGAELSDVIPLAAASPLLSAAAFLTMQSGSAAMPPPAMPARPAKKRARKRARP